MATPATVVVLCERKSERERGNFKRTTRFCCQAVVGSSFMSFEAWDVVVVIYSFYYQDFTTLLVPNRHHTLEITMEACI